MQLSTLAAGLTLAVLLAAIAWIDARRQIIPNELNAALAASGALVMFFLPEPGITNALLGSLGGFAILWALRSAYARFRGFQGLGLGDVKFVGAAGLWIGATGLPWMLLAAALSGLGWALIAALMHGRLEATQRLSFGPHLCIGLFAAWMMQALGVW